MMGILMLLEILTSEVNDSAETLAQALNVSEKEAQKMITDQGLKNEDCTTGNCDPKQKVGSGQTLKVDNNMTRAISKSEGVTATEVISGLKSKSEYDLVNDKYICDQCDAMSVNGEEITPQNAKKYNFFSPKGKERIGSFKGLGRGQGTAVIGGAHVVTLYVNSAFNIPYVLNKMGRSFKPEVVPLQTVVNQLKSNGWKNVSIKYYKN